MPAHNKSVEPVEKPAIMPEVFSGKEGEDFGLWLSQFDIAAVVNGWSDTDKTNMLALRLRGAASRAFHSLPTESRVNFKDVCRILEQKFNPVERASVYRAILQSRRQKGDERLIDLAEDIRATVRRAYPQVRDGGTLDQLALDSFLAALDESLRRRVRDAEPETLDDALHKALKYDAFDEADRRAGVPNPIVIMPG